MTEKESDYTYQDDLYSKEVRKMSNLLIKTISDNISTCAVLRESQMKFIIDAMVDLISRIFHSLIYQLTYQLTPKEFSENSSIILDEMFKKIQDNINESLTNINKN